MLCSAQDKGAFAASLGDDTARSVDLHLRVSLVSAVGLDAYMYQWDRAADKMPTAVRKAIAFSCEKEGEMSEKDAQAYVEQLEAEGRIQEETWS